MPRLLGYDDAPPEARAVFDEIKAARGVPDVNNFWKALAVDPPLLRRTWDSLRVVMALAGGGASASRRQPSSGRRRASTSIMLPRACMIRCASCSSFSCSPRNMNR